MDKKELMEKITRLRMLCKEKEKQEDSLAGYHKKQGDEIQAAYYRGRSIIYHFMVMEMDNIWRIE